MEEMLSRGTVLGERPYLRCPYALTVTDSALNNADIGGINGGGKVEVLAMKVQH